MSTVTPRPFSAILSKAQREDSQLRAKEFADQASTLPFGAIHSFRHGEVLTQQSGGSLEFSEHRSYFFGDDPRHINWNAYARSESLLVKVFQRESAPRVDILLDRTSSMVLEEHKAVATFELAVFFYELAQNFQATVSFRSLDGKFDPYPCARDVFSQRLEEHLIFHRELEVQEQEVESPACSVRIIISDLLFELEGSDIFQRLLSARDPIMVIAPFTLAEMTPEWFGSFRFEDCESAAVIEREVNASVLSQYRRRYLSHFEVWSSYLRKNGVELLRVPVPRALENLVEAFEAMVGGGLIRSGSRR